MFVDKFWEIDHWAIDTQMVYLQEHLVMRADDPKLQWEVSNLGQPSSTTVSNWLTKESLQTRLPLWTFLLPQM